MNWHVSLRGHTYFIVVTPTGNLATTYVWSLAVPIRRRLGWWWCSHYMNLDHHDRESATADADAAATIAAVVVWLREIESHFRLAEEALSNVSLNGRNKVEVCRAQFGVCHFLFHCFLVQPDGLGADSMRNMVTPTNISLRICNREKEGALERHLRICIERSSALGWNWEYTWYFL